MKEFEIKESDIIGGDGEFSGGSLLDELSILKDYLTRAISNEPHEELRLRMVRACNDIMNHSTLEGLAKVHGNLLDLLMGSDKQPFSDVWISVQNNGEIYILPVE